MMLSMFQALIQLCPTPVSATQPIHLFIAWGIFLLQACQLQLWHVYMVLPVFLLWPLHHVSEPQTVPPVQVFDKTMVVKQVHVLEPQDLLITRADKGTLRPHHLFRAAHQRLPPRGAVFCHLPHSFFISTVFIFFLIIPIPLSSFISVISPCVVEYILTLSTFVAPPNTLISGCDLRKLTYREPIPVEVVYVCIWESVCVYSAWLDWLWECSGL